MGFRNMQEKLEKICSCDREKLWKFEAVVRFSKQWYSVTKIILTYCGKKIEQQRFENAFFPVYFQGFLVDFEAKVG